jgi:hypothetical protein
MPVNENSASFRAAAKALTQYGDKGLLKEVRADMRKAAKPLGEKVIREGAAVMPKRGGLSAELAKAKMSQTNTTTGRNPGVVMVFRTKPSHDLKSMDEGIVRHPIYGHRGKGQWRETKVMPGAYSRPFEAGAPDVAHEIVSGLKRIVDDVARRTNGGV